MSGLLATSMVVRYLTGDPSDLAERASQVIDQEEDLQISDVVIVETAYVLTSFYKVPREVVVDNLILFLQKKNIHPFALDKDSLLQALLLCRPSGRVSFADALIWAVAKSTEEKVVYTLDERFPRDGVEIRIG
ncbi:MAG TPA: PIN domain-containing protein [Anaerolineales bacterium]|nr:PIN domain-containing protein [Anaerolineales bacterium]